VAIVQLGLQADFLLAPHGLLRRVRGD